MAERSRDMNENHRRCQQCRLNAGLPLCTQDSPCLVCKDWLPEAWKAHAKATAQRNRRKAAAVEGNWDDGRLSGITRTKARFYYQASQVWGVI